MSSFKTWTKHPKWLWALESKFLHLSSLSPVLLQLHSLKLTVRTYKEAFPNGNFIFQGQPLIFRCELLVSGTRVLLPRPQLSWVEFTKQGPPPTKVSSSRWQIPNVYHVSYVSRGDERRVYWVYTTVHIYISHLHTFTTGGPPYCKPGFVLFIFFVSDKFFYWRNLLQIPNCREHQILVRKLLTQFEYIWDIHPSRNNPKNLHFFGRLPILGLGSWVFLQVFQLSFSLNQYIDKIWQVFAH